MLLQLDALVVTLFVGLVKPPDLRGREVYQSRSVPLVVEVGVDNVDKFPLVLLMVLPLENVLDMVLSPTQLARGQLLGIHDLGPAHLYLLLRLLALHVQFKLF